MFENTYMVKNKWQFKIQKKIPGIQSYMKMKENLKEDLNSQRQRKWKKSVVGEM